MIEPDKQTVFFDLETGGLDYKVHPIIQIAAIAVDDATYKEVDSIDIRIAFNIGDCNDKSLKLNCYGMNGHTPITWAINAVSQKEAINRFSRFCKKHASIKSIAKKTQRTYYTARMSGHNAANFDFKFLRKFYSDNNEYMPFSWSILDTMHRARWFFYENNIDIASFSLSSLCKFFDIDLPEEEAHNALVDVRATVELANIITSDGWNSQ